MAVIATLEGPVVLITRTRHDSRCGSLRAWLCSMPAHATRVDDRQTFDIIGAAIDVHKKLGCGFLERVYREPFTIELALRSVPFERERTLRVRYKGRVMPSTYIVDFLSYGEIVVELKALSTLSPVEHAQAINYLRVAGLRRALLLNFGARSLQFKRIVWDPPDSRTRPRQPSV